MSRITKDLANSVANSMVKKRSEELAKYKKETGVILWDHLITKVPKAVSDAFDDVKTKDYIKTNYDFDLIGEGLNFDHVSCKKVPFIQDGYNPRVTLPKVIATKISKRVTHAYSETKEVNSLRKETEATLISLRTYKKVQESFPEAAAFLPEDPAKANLPVNLDLLRKKLK